MSNYFNDSSIREIIPKFFLKWHYVMMKFINSMQVVRNLFMVISQ